jgi:hypothetical protein
MEWDSVGAGSRDDLRKGEMGATMNYQSCYGCGVVVDFDVPTIDHEEVLNHDQDKKCDAVRCPVCKELILSEEWKDVGE